LTINVNTDKKNLAAALALLDDLLRNPKFDAAEFDKAVLDAKASTEANMSDPQTIVSEKLSKLTTNYPKGHPSYASSSAEQLEELAKTSLDDVKNFYKDFYGANNSISAFVGELDKNTITGFLNKTFGTWDSKMKFTAIAPKHFDVKGGTEAINTPDKTNAVVLGNININISETHKDYPALFMANELLGGGAFLSSRIPMRLRENEGMSYGAGTYMNSNYKYDVTNWGLYAIFNPLYKGRLDSAMHQEIDKAIAAGFTKDELTKSVSAWIEGNKTSLGMNDFLARQLRWYIRDGRDLTDFTNFESRVKALTTDAVNAAMKKYFDKSKLVVVYGGEFDKTKPADKPAEKKGF